MKRLWLCSLALFLLMTMAGCSSNEQPTGSKPNQTTSTLSTTEIDASSIIRTEQAGFLSVSTDSIKTVLQHTGRFEFLEVPQQSGIDVFGGLDKVEGESLATVSFTILGDCATERVSYNFSKESVQGESVDAIRWGLDVLLQLFGDRLAEDTWQEILAIASQTQEVDSLGIDYPGYSNAETGIRLIYADLGSNVQIDLQPYDRS